MTIDFSTYPNVDAAIKERTEQFFEHVRKEAPDDTQLSRLVQQGIYIETRDLDKYTPLIEAAANGLSKTVQALLAAGANKEAQNVNCDTALIKAAAHNHTKIVQALLAAGANIEARGIEGTTALIWAATHGYTEVAQVLLAAGANIEARDDLGSTALMLAASNGHAETLQALLAAGANIEIRNGDGNTALIWAVSNEKVDTVRVLLEAGANIEACDRFGVAALTLSRDDMIDQLLEPLEWHASYTDFTANGTAPKSAQDIYHMLAVTPLLEPRAPVDHAGNIQKIFAHAQWSNKEQAASILAQMQRDGRINAETVDSILHNAFPERSHAAARLQRSDSVRAL